MTLRRFLTVAVAFGLIAAYPSSSGFAKDKEIQVNPDLGAGSSAAEIMALQLPLVQAGDAIRGLDPDREGLGGIRLRVLERTIEIYWKGKVASGVHEQVAKLEAQGYRAEIRHSRYSGRELARAQEKVTSQAYPGLAMVAPQPDGSGLQVRFSKGNRPLTQWPIAVEVVQQDEFVLTDRGNDVSPFWAGAVARHIIPPVPNIIPCSTGFAVYRRHWFTVTEGILTAQHCGAGVFITNGDGTRTIGLAETPSAHALVFQSDSSFVPTNSSNRMFDGPPTGAFSKAVVGRTGNFIGQFVCNSGAATGVHCDIMTDVVNATVELPTLRGGVNRIQMVSMGRSIGGGTAVGRGDSGGPVFTLSGTGVLGAGMISLGQNPVACNVPGPAACFNRVGWVDLAWVLQAQQAEIMVADMA
jgi:hypothetical protein